MRVRFLPGAQRIDAKASRCKPKTALQYVVNMFTVYLLESIRTGKWYIGFTPRDVYKRVNKHNRKEVLSTKAFAPWKLIYFECYLNRADATSREKFLKSGAGRNFLKKQLKYYLGSIR